MQKSLWSFLVPACPGPLLVWMLSDTEIILKDAKRNLKIVLIVAPHVDKRCETPHFTLPFSFYDVSTQTSQN